MNAALQRTESYVQAQQLAPRRPPTRQPRGGPFVTISREAGAGASSLAGLLQHRLEARTGASWTVFDGNLITAMLQANHLPPQLARFLPEARVSGVEATIGEILGLHPSLWELSQKTDEFIRWIAGTGHVILVGRGANFATTSLPHGVHVRLVAPADHRARVMAKRHGVSHDEAAGHNRRQDQTRRRYVRTHFHAVGPDPTNYDFVINTGRVSLDQAADVIVPLVLTRAAAK